MTMYIDWLYSRMVAPSIHLTSTGVLLRVHLAVEHAGPCSVGACITVRRQHPAINLVRGQYPTEHAGETAQCMCKSYVHPVGVGGGFAVEHACCPAAW